MNMIPSTSKALALACLLAPGLNAVTLATYDFDGAVNNVQSPSYAVGSYDNTALQSAGDLTYFASSGGSQGITPQGDTVRGNPVPSIKDQFTNTGFSATTLDSAIDNDDYFSFTLTPTSGNTLNFGGSDSVSFDTQIFYTGDAVDPGSTTMSFSLLSSVDGFASSADQVGTTQTFTFNNVGGTESGFSNLSISLASLGTIGTDVPLELRLYVFREFSGSGDVPFASERFMNIDNIVTTGSSIIPEPSSSTVALGSFILLFVLAGVRKVRRQEQA